MYHHILSILPLLLGATMPLHKGTPLHHYYAWELGHQSNLTSLVAYPLTSQRGAPHQPLSPLPKNTPLSFTFDLLTGDSSGAFCRCWIDVTETFLTDMNMVYG